MIAMRDGDPQRSAWLAGTLKVTQPLALVATIAIAAATLFAWASRSPPRHAELIRSVALLPSADRFVPSAAQWSHLTLLPVEEIALPASFRGNAAPTLAIQATAIIEEGETAHVWVATDDGALVRRPVVTGSAQNGMVEIVSGLSAGERALATGALLVERAARSGGPAR
jgi:hypothetical protein